VFEKRAAVGGWRSDLSTAGYTGFGKATSAPRQCFSAWLPLLVPEKPASTPPLTRLSKSGHDGVPLAS